MKRRLLSLLALCLCLLCLAACGEESVRSAEAEDDRVVLTIEGEEICYDYFRYAFLRIRDELAYRKNSEGLSDAEFEALVKEQTLSFLLRYRSVQLLAEEADIALTDDEEEEILDEIAELIDVYGEDAFEEELQRTYMTQYTLTYLKRLDTVQTLWKLYATEEQSGVIRCDDETVLADIPEHFTRIRYVYIEKKESVTDQNRSHAELILSYAKEGQDFKELIRSYGEDNTMLLLIDDGYYYTILSEDAVEEAVALLDEGEISDLIEVSHGWFIVQKLPLDMAYVDENFEEFRSLYKNRVLEELVEAKMQTLSVEFGEIWQNATTQTVQ